MIRIKFSMCLETVFAETGFYERFQPVKDLGLDAAEFWEPEKYDAKKIGAVSAKSGLPVLSHCIFDARNTTLNSEWERLEANIKKTVEFGEEAGCGNFIGLAGNVTNKADSQKMIITENLKRAAEICEKKGVNLFVEALNSVEDHLGYYLDSSYIGFEIIKTVNSPRVKLLYDIYHMQLMEGNIVNNLINNVKLVGHIHSAGVPGRKEPHTGELNYPFVVEKLAGAGYAGHFGFEYFPSYGSRESIRDVMDYIRGSRGA